MHWNTHQQISTYGCCFWKSGYPTLEQQTPSHRQSCCCGPVPVPSCWTAAWPKERGAHPPASHLLPKKRHVTNTSGAGTKVTTFKWRNSHLCFCRGLVFGMLLRGWRALDVKLLRCLFSSGVTYGSSSELRTIHICWKKKPKKKKKELQLSLVVQETNLDFSVWPSFFAIPCFLVLGLRRIFAASSFIFPVATVLPFFFTGS